MDKQDIKAQKMEILTLSFNQLRKQKKVLVTSVITSINKIKIN